VTDRRRPWRVALALAAVIFILIGPIGPFGYAFGADPTAPLGTPTCFERYADSARSIKAGTTRGIWPQRAAMMSAL
jgi:hypothetical protein